MPNLKAGEWMWDPSKMTPVCQGGVAMILPPMHALISLLNQTPNLNAYQTMNYYILCFSILSYNGSFLCLFELHAKEEGERKEERQRMSLGLFFLQEVLQRETSILTDIFFIVRRFKLCQSLLSD